MRPDLISELSWRHGLNDFAMPFQLQVQREQYNRLSSLEALVKKLSAKDEKKEKEESEAPILMGQGRLMIGAAPSQGLNGFAQPPIVMPQQTGMPGFY